jgi:CheY-like chemotaxis protein
VQRGKKDRGPRMRILAVDDDDIILEILKETLGQAGYHDLQVAGSGAEALSMLSQADADFDCLLLDIQMPEMDGIELCRRIRTHPEHQRTPILMITAMSDKSYIDNSFAAGATDYVTKPFDVIEVITRVRMAERLVEERRRTQDRSSALNALECAIEVEEHCKLNETIEIADVGGVIEYLAFENYLLQLSRSKQFMSALIAIKITNIADIFNRCSARYFRYFITDVAEALSDSLTGRDFLMAYRGAGMFVFAYDRRRHERLFEDLKDNFQFTLNEIAPVFDDGTGMKINAVIGDPKFQGLMTNKGSLERLWRAIDSAEHKALNRQQGAAMGAQTPGGIFSDVKIWQDPITVFW